MPDSEPIRRGRRLYDRWAAHGSVYRLVDAMTRGLRKEAIELLELRTGDTVVDLGCGPGDSLALLEDAVGDDGAVVGVDYSEKMVRRANRRVSETPSATVVQSDAGRLPVRSDTVDGVFASLALSAMPELRSVLSEVNRVLCPDGRLVVVDGRAPSGTLGRLLTRVYARLVNFQHPDTPSILQEAFPKVDVVRSFDAGLGFIARAEVG